MFTRALSGLNRSKSAYLGRIPVLVPIALVAVVGLVGCGLRR